jgi:hypothetical protein
MHLSDSRLQSIAATFAVHYYTTLVQAPQDLAALYTANAHVVHCLQKASGSQAISALLTTVTAKGVKEVKLEDVAATRTTSGGIKVSIVGHLITEAAGSQAFTQEVELREQDRNVFGITSDKFSYAAGTPAGQTAWTAAETAAKTVKSPTPAAQPVKAQAEKKEKMEAPAASAPREDAALSRKSTPAPAAGAATEAATAPVAEPRKKPANFAEALKMNMVGDGAAFSNKTIRVVASDKTKATTAAEKTDKAEKAEKSDKKKGGNGKEGKSAKPRASDEAAGASAAAAPVVYYDIILKELAPSITEEEVRALVTPVAAVKLVNVVKSARRRRGKEGEKTESAVITFAFVQLDHPAEAPASHVKDVIAKLSEHHKDLHVEEVREKREPAGKRPADAAHTRKRPEHKTKTAAPAKSQ